MPIKTEKDISAEAKGPWLKALSAVELKNHGYAIQLLRGVVKQEPEFLKARQVLRRSEFAANSGKKSFLSFGGGLGSFGSSSSQVKKDPFKAMETAEDMLEKDPGSSKGNRLLKDAALAADLPEIATFALETLRRAKPKDTKVLHELAEHYLEHGEPDKAVEVYHAITEENPSDMEAVKGAKDASARASMSKGGWEEAAEEESGKDYRDLMANKDEAVALEQKGRVVRSEEMIDNLLGELSEKYEKEPENIEVVRRIAELYEQKNDLESAIQWYEYASSLASGADPALARKAGDLRLRNVEDKISSLEKQVEEEGDAADESLRQELKDLKQQRSETQLKVAKQRVDRNPTDLQVRFEYGKQLMDAGRHGEAIPELQKARQNPNVRLKAMNLLGQCMIEKGMLDLAAKQFKEAASEVGSMDNLKKELLYNLGLAYEKMDKKEEYIDAMKEIYEVDYGYRDVAERVEASYSET